MQPLETNRKVLMWLSGYPPDKSVGKWKKIAYILFTFAIIMAHLLSVVAGGTFIYRNRTNHLQETLYSLIHTLGSANMLYQSIVTVLLRHKLAKIFEGLTTIYYESNHFINQIEKLKVSLFSLNKILILFQFR